MERSEFRELLRDVTERGAARAIAASAIRSGDDVRDVPFGEGDAAEVESAIMGALVRDAGDGFFGMEGVGERAKRMRDFMRLCPAAKDAVSARLDAEWASRKRAEDYAAEWRALVGVDE